MAQRDRPRIEGQHGWLMVDGTRYEHDIVIHIDGAISERNCGCSPELRSQLSNVYLKDFFHAPLTEWELDFLQDERPEVVIIGAGFKGMLPLTPKAKDILARYEHRVLSTPQAIEVLNAEGRRFVAILHSTC
ncbi:MAG: MTH938/NDUFAF3 family protein [Methanomassiliicoccus sp.]|nr:MTH938/NDUFAF3 family protein [Methanomassiliicoccus sp.]